MISRDIAEPLELESLVWAQGLFAEDLPHYPAEWVWHGLLLANANDVARFMASSLVQDLREPLTHVAGKHPGWRDPHYGYGLMVEPGQRFGHNGGGPGFSASCFHFETTGKTLCVLMRSAGSDSAEPAMRQLLELHTSTQADN